MLTFIAILFIGSLMRAIYETEQTKNKQRMANELKQRYEREKETLNERR